MIKVFYTVGLPLLEAIREAKPKIPVIMMTAHGTTSLAIEATQKGAFDYLIKPFRTSDLIEVLESAAQTSRMTARKLDIGEHSPGKDSIIGECREMQKVYREIGRIANKNVTALIRGETGTGKELIARAIFQHSDRSEKPFVAVNCTAIPDNLLESELFGHEKGAFTGALARRIGRFEQADQGTLFLDEIGDMSADTQVKMLRVLQEKVIRRVGGNEEVPVDVRVIAATHQNLEKAVAEGRFREDLYYRINTAIIELPPLRERGDDIELLIRHFVARYCEEFEAPVPSIGQNSVDRLLQHRWPGNVRELENTTAKLILRANGFPVQPSDIDDLLSKGKEAAVADQSLDSGETHVRKKIRDVLVQAQDGKVENPYLQLIEDLEREIIFQAVDLTHGNQSAAARLLGISRITYREKLDKFGLLRKKKPD